MIYYLFVTTEWELFRKLLYRSNGRSPYLLCFVYFRLGPVIPTFVWIYLDDWNVLYNTWFSNLESYKMDLSYQMNKCKYTLSILKHKS